MVMSADGELEEDVGEAAISDEVDRTYRKFEARESKTKTLNDERRMSLIQQLPVRVLSGLNHGPKTLLLV